MMKALRGEHAVVTGGGRGIGAAVAGALAALGADVSITGRDAARLSARVDELARNFDGRRRRCTSSAASSPSHASTTW